MEVVKENQEMGTPATEQKPDNKFVNKVVLQKGRNDSYAIIRNKLLMPCPFRQPIVSQRVVNKPKTIETLGGSEQEPEIITDKEVFYCNSICPLFQFSDSKQSSQSIVVDLCCGHNLHYRIDTILPYVEPKVKTGPEKS